MKTAILMVSFGTADLTVRARSLDLLKADLQQAFPQMPVYEAYTSSFMRKRLQKQNRVMPDLEEQLRNLLQQGIAKIWVQPTHLTAGEEVRRKIMPVMEQWRDSFVSLQLGKPLLESAPPAEYLPMLLSEDAGKVVVFMGHGSPHAHNPLYERFQQAADAGHFSVHIGVLEENDRPNLANVLERLRADKCSSVCLRLLLLMSGNHVREELKQVWQPALTALVPVETDERGLAEYPAFRAFVIERMRQEMNRRFS